jgi:hypothetical protein
VEPIELDGQRDLEIPLAVLTDPRSCDHCRSRARMIQKEG